MDPPHPPVAGEELLAAVLESAVHPIWVVGPGGAIRAAGAAALEALGYERLDELQGRDSHDTIHRRADGSRFPAADCRLLAPLRTGESAESDLDWFARRDGSLMAVSYVSVPLGLADGGGAVVAFAAADPGDADAPALERETARAARQASLRRAARRAADVIESVRIFTTITTQLARLVGLPLLQVWRLEPGGTGTVLGTWSERPHRFGPRTRWTFGPGSLAERVRATRRAALLDDHEAAPGEVAVAVREAGIGGVAAAPVVVEGQVWGLLVAGQHAGLPLPDDVERRMAPCTELVATRISVFRSRQELARLADEQAALRRVATLVAREVPAGELFAVVARELGLLLDVDVAHMGRYEPDGTAVGVASWARDGDPIGVETAPPGGETTDGAGPMGAALRARGLRFTAGAPIVVDGRPWGVMVVAARREAQLPGGIGERIAGFAELVATAISNLEARTERARLAAEQEGLRRVATQVARDVAPAELFAEVASTVGALLGADLAGMIRYVGHDEITPVATWARDGAHPPVSGRWPVRDGDLAALLRDTRRPARIDDWSTVPGEIGAFIREQMGVRSTAGSPIFVRGDLWGGLFVHSRDERVLPADTEQRLASFAELVATALANTQARSELAQLADEQTALRRVATLVAQAAPPEAVFAAVGEELGRLMWSAPTQLVRFEDDETATVVAGWGDAITPAGQKISLQGDSVSSLVHRTGRPARISADRWSGPLGEYALSFGLRWGVGAPVVVDGRVWGAMTVVSRAAEPFPADTEARVASFAELVAAAISNVEARAALAASRSRVVAAADEERQRVVRDLHDGAQQRLVHTIVTLKLALTELEDADATGRAFVTEALEQAERATDELRHLSHGMLPEVLTRGGLAAGIAALASRAPVPVTVDVRVGRVPPAVEATAYFVVAEALTNIAKHADAGVAEVAVGLRDGALHVGVRDDGLGGAHPGGPGLLGLTDRLAAVEGHLEIDSPPGLGTRIAATIPLPPS